MASTISIDVIFNAINKTGSVVNQVNRGFSGVLNNMWKVNQAAEGLDRLSNAIERIGAPGAEYDFGLKEFSSITGVAGKELNDLGKLARQVGKESGVGATASLNAFKILAGQLDTDEIGMAGLAKIQKDVITLSQASPGLGMAGAADALAGTLNQFGLAAEHSSRIMNVLAAGSKVAGAEIPDLAGSFKIVGANAAAAGLSVEQTAGALEVLSNNQIKGSEAGTMFRNVLLALQTNLGFDLKVTKLSDALATLQGKEGDAAYMAKVFGRDAMGAAQYLIKNADLVEEYTEKVTGTSTATEQAAIMTDTFIHRMKVVRARLNDFSIGFFQLNQGLIGWVQMGGQAAATFTAVSPVVAMFGKGITSSVSGIITFTRATRLMNMAMAAGKFNTYSALIERYGMAGRVAAAGIWTKNKAVAAGTFISKLFNAETRTAMLLQLRQATASKIQAAWTWIAGKAQLVASGTAALWGKRMMVTGAIQAWWSRGIALSGLTLKGLRGAFIGVIAQTWAWTAALWANPITWIIAAIIALVAGIALAWKHFDWFRGGIIGAWEAVKKFGQILWESIINPIKMIIGGVGKLIDAFKLFKKGDMSGAREALKGGLSDIGKGMVQSTPIGVAMNVVKRRDEIGQAWSSGYEKGKAIDTSKFLDFGSMFNRGQEQPAQPVGMQTDFPASSMQVPGLDFGSMFNRGQEQPVQPAGIQTGLPAGRVIPMIPKITEGATTNYNHTTHLKNENNTQVNNADLNQLTRNITQNIASTTTNQHSQDNRESRIEVNYNPQVHISADLTRESQDNLLKMLNVHKDQLMKLIKEELRKEGRLAYAG